MIIVVPDASASGAEANVDPPSMEYVYPLKVAPLLDPATNVQVAIPLPAATAERRGTEGTSAGTKDAEAELSTDKPACVCAFSVTV